MKRPISFILAGMAALAACGRHPAQAQSWYWHGYLTIEGGRDAEKCSDLQPRATGELAQATQTFTLSKQEAPTLEVRGASRTALHVRGWDRPEYSVEVCKFAAAASRSAADRTLRSIAVTRSGGRFSIAGADPDSHWQAVFFVHAPKDAALDLQAGNGPIDAARVNGKLMLRATNGPLSLDHCSGTVDAETVNGPISMNAGSGDVHLRATNGPISLKLADAAWNGPQLEARTENGPVSVTLPTGFRSGLRVETSGHAPIRCQADACVNARTEGNRFFPRLLETGSGDVVRLSTHNGPVSVNGPGGRRARVI